MDIEGPSEDGQRERRVREKPEQKENDGRSCLQGEKERKTGNERREEKRER